MNSKLHVLHEIFYCIVVHKCRNYLISDGSKKYAISQSSSEAGLYPATRANKPSSSAPKLPPRSVTEFSIGNNRLCQSKYYDIISM